MNIIVNLAFEVLIQATRFFNWKWHDGLFVALFGGPGAGKGTIASRLSPHYDIPHLNMGSILEREIAQGTPVGKRWESWVRAGKLLPDKVVFKLLRTELKKPEFKAGAVLDGFPRTVSQAKKLRWMLAWWGNKVDVVIFLDVARPDLIERLSHRRTCTVPECKTSFHLTLNPPKVENVCDKCGAPLFQRKDDQPEVITTRLNAYDRTFGPVGEYYRSQGIFVRIQSNNRMSVDDVLEEVMFAVDEVD